MNSPDSDLSTPSESDVSALDGVPPHRAIGGSVTARATSPKRKQSRWTKLLWKLFPAVAVVAVAGFFAARYWMRTALQENLPVVDGQVTVEGLNAPVTVVRDAQGVPHIGAQSVEDLIFAQGYVTAGDRLFQMDALRRHAAGELAEVLGSKLVEHDLMQRTLQLRAAADRALAVLPTDQMHWLDAYARGVNASIREQQAHLPLEFQLLRYQPARWTPRDSLLAGLAMFQDLTMTFPRELDREALSARLPPELLEDLYPVGSWRDHPAGQPALDLTAPQPESEEIPLDESQSRLRRGHSRERLGTPVQVDSDEHIADLLHARLVFSQASTRYACGECLPGSNGWAVSGTKTRSGKPMLSNDMHLEHGVPGIWYMADLQAGAFHVSGVTLPGTPFVIVGHNQHIAWGFTNLGAEVQDLYIEHTRGEGTTAEFESADGGWQPLLHRSETVHVRGGSDVTLDVTATQHGGIATPIVSGLYPHEKRSIALRWTIYDPANITSPFYAVNAATDWQGLCAATATFGGPAQNLMYADDQGHIGYHAIGKVPVRGSMAAPSALSPVPTDGRDAGQEWVGYIPFDQMPQSFDPPSGFVATANARVVPDGYAFPVTLDWAAPYRNERIWKLLQAKSAMTPADMLALQTDVYSDLDEVIAQRLAYAIDHASTVHADSKSSQSRRLRQAADLLRVWDGTVEKAGPDGAAAAIVDAARQALWPLILAPQLGVPVTPAKATDALKDGDPLRLYNWGEEQYAEEQILVHAPARWLPPKYADWNELLTAAVERGLESGKAPSDVTQWKYGEAHSVDIEHPIYSQSPLLEKILGLPTGTGVQPQSGDSSTVKQVRRAFGPSERMTVDFGDLDNSTLNIVLGQSANPASEWFMDQWPAWYRGSTFAMPFSDGVTKSAARHTLILVP